MVCVCVHVICILECKNVKKAPTPTNYEALCHFSNKEKGIHYTFAPIIKGIICIVCHYKNAFR